MSDKRCVLKSMRLLSACCLALALAFSCLAVGGCAKADEAEETTALVRVDAPGWDAETSSPVILVVTESGSDAPAFARAVAANADEEIPLAAGDYKVELVAPINADGSTYEAIDVIETSAPADEGAYALNVTLSLIPAGDVSADRMAEILDGIARAASVGDETLAGENGHAVVNIATLNAAACPVLDAEQVEELADAAENAVAEGPVAKPSAGASPDSTQGGSEAGSTSVPSASGEVSPGSGSGSNSTPSVPSHEHSWTAVTEQRWVVDQAAWEEVIHTDTIYCNCGMTWPSTVAWGKHCEQLMLNGGGCGYTVKTTTDYVYHDEVGHYETVTTGYKCSCGATK